MIELSKQRTAADNQFLKIQTRSLSLARIVTETERVSQQRADNTVRLKELRLAKEALDLQAALAIAATKKAPKKRQ